VYGSVARGPGSPPRLYFFLAFSLLRRFSRTAARSRFHLVNTALRAISRRRSGVSASARARPPLRPPARPPRRPSATAAWFLRFAMRRILAPVAEAQHHLHCLNRFKYYLWHSFNLIDQEEDAG
jgi:hypothetical protein